ncbi:hypothetical protein GC194_01770 [bacterium]|nr:hypothetical protein [bacterium]
MRFWITTLFIACVLQAHSTGYFDSKGPYARAMGGTSLALSNPWACFNNQAALSFIKEFQLGVSGAQIYNVSQLNTANMAAAIPVKNVGVLGLSLDHLGITGLYSQQRLGFSMARLFGDNFSVGMQIEAYHLNLFDYGNTWLVNAHIGFLFVPSKNLKLGFQLQNPYGTMLYEKYSERLPTIARIGGSYQLSDQFQLYAEESLSTQGKPRLHVGGAYEINDKITLRTGVQTAELSSSFGLDINLNKIRIILAFSYHQYLGSTPEIGMSYVAK